MSWALGKDDWFLKAVTPPEVQYSVFIHAVCFKVMNLHSCIQVNVDFVSPEHAHNSYYLTQELRPLKDQVNYEDKLQVPPSGYCDLCC